MVKPFPDVKMPKAKERKEKELSTESEGDRPPCMEYIPTLGWFLGVNGAAYMAVP